jgi:hypothetical protein
MLATRRVSTPGDHRIDRQDAPVKLVPVGVTKHRLRQVCRLRRCGRTLGEVVTQQLGRAPGEQHSAKVKDDVHGEFQAVMPRAYNAWNRGCVVGDFCAFGSMSPPRSRCSGPRINTIRPTI